MSNPLYTHGSTPRSPTVCLSHLIPIITADTYLSIVITDVAYNPQPDDNWDLSGSILYTNPLLPLGNDPTITGTYCDWQLPVQIGNNQPAFCFFEVKSLTDVIQLNLTFSDGHQAVYFFDVFSLLIPGGL